MCEYHKEHVCVCVLLEASNMGDLNGNLEETIIPVRTQDRQRTYRVFHDLWTILQEVIS